MSARRLSAPRTLVRVRHLLTLLCCAALAACDGGGGDAPEDCTPYTTADCPEGGEGLYDDGCGGHICCGEDCDACLATCPAGACGQVDDNCGGTLDCGACGCVKTTCAAVNRCGVVEDGCGGTMTCGCAAPNSCQEDGQCTCTPLTCADLGDPSGEAYDGCGHFIQCAGSGSSTERLRILAGNLTTSGSLTLSDGTTANFSETWDPGHGRRILQGLAPQVALLQEFKTLRYEKERTGYWRNSAESLRDFVSSTFGDRFYAYRENRTGMTLGKPNGVVSYYPIKAAGEFPSALDNIRDRQHVWARIDIPGDKDLWVVSVHLTTGGSASGMSETNARKAEMQRLIADIESLNIPAGDFVAIGGDFNISSRTEACMNSLKSSGLVFVDTEQTCPVDQSGNGDTNANRNQPYDGVFVSTALANFQTMVSISGASRLSRDGLVFDSRRFSPLSAVSPVLKSDSDADSMQHMAVLKDFAVPR